jgi:hypothetical protein
MLSVVFSYCYAECRYAECRGAVVWAKFSTLSPVVFVITVVALHRQAHPRLKPGFSMVVKVPWWQGALTEGEGSVLLTSSY